MRAGVIVFPGSNCDRDLAVAFERSGAKVSMIWHKDTVLPDGLDVIGIPGGFSFGDYLRCGAIAARSPVCRAVVEHAHAGGYVIGICNGFQVLVKARVLPGFSDVAAQPITLTANDSGKFECHWIHLKINRDSPCVFTRGMSSLYIPVAHGEGKLAATPETLDKLNVVVQYTDSAGNLEAGYPHNPNGSLRDIAGICDATGRIFALMPHPERFLRWTQHPRWTRETPRDIGEGLQVFRNAVDWVQRI